MYGYHGTGEQRWSGTRQIRFDKAGCQWESKNQRTTLNVSHLAALLFNNVLGLVENHNLVSESCVGDAFSQSRPSASY